MNEKIEGGKTFSYHKFTGELDFADWTVTERLEQAQEALAKACQQALQIKAYSAQQRAIVLAYTDFFDAFLGAHAANALLGETTNLDAVVAAYDALYAFFYAQNQQAAKRYAAVAEKYIPRKA